jgi:hypothetical protein
VSAFIRRIPQTPNTLFSLHRFCYSEICILPPHFLPLARVPLVSSQLHPSRCPLFSSTDISGCCSSQSPPLPAQRSFLPHIGLRQLLVYGFVDYLPSCLLVGRFRHLTPHCDFTSFLPAQHTSPSQLLAISVLPSCLLDVSFCR